MPFAYAALAAGVIGVATSAVGAEQQASAQKQAANYQAVVAQNNAKAAQQAAAFAKQSGQASEQAMQLKTRALTGAQFVAQAKNGIDVNSGSAVQVRTSSAITGKYDALTVRNNAENQALAYQNEGVNYTAQAGVDRAAGVNAAAAGDTDAMSSLLSGASSLSAKWSMLLPTLGGGGGGSGSGS